MRLFCDRQTPPLGLNRTLSNHTLAVHLILVLDLANQVPYCTVKICARGRIMSTYAVSFVSGYNVAILRYLFEYQANVEFLIIKNGHVRFKRRIN